jgi:hypothetical protein
MNRLCLMIEKWAPLASAAALLVFTWSLCGCTISPIYTTPVSAPLSASVAAQGGAPAMAQAVVVPVTKQAQVAVAAAKSTDSLNLWGTLAIIAGAIGCVVPACPNGWGLGTLFGGLICILAGILLPAYAVWIGWGLVGAVALFYLGRIFLPKQEAAVLAQFVNKPSPNA